jgi:polyhydroxybutyrate depolymerase
MIPLVVALHCYSCPASHLPDTLALDALAEKHHFALAAPASGHTDHNGNSFWNATPACCDFEGKGYDDVGAVVKLIDERVKKGEVDPKRVYLVGFSNGAFLAWQIACTHADKIAAIVVIGGAAPMSCTPSSPVAVLEVHGRDDTTVPVSGRKLGGGLPQRASFPSAKEALAVWGRVDHCTVGAPDCRVQQWLLPGGHWPDTGKDFGERVWTWLATQHK